LSLFVINNVLNARVIETRCKDSYFCAILQKIKAIKRKYLRIICNKRQRIYKYLQKSAKYRALYLHFIANGAAYFFIHGKGSARPRLGPVPGHGAGIKRPAARRRARARLPSVAAIFLDKQGRQRQIRKV
jgi:hypothetical protein